MPRSPKLETTRSAVSTNLLVIIAIKDNVKSLENSLHASGR